MIAVIADDFTGAAEIGGLGLLYGYKTAIVTKVNALENIDLLIIATEMRAFDSEKAVQESEKITKELLKLNPEFIYKKIDSVLRGNIGVEIKAQLKASEKSRALVVPANPILNRIINNGIYYIDGKPLIESKFANDLVFKAKSSKVLDIIGRTDDLSITSVSHNVKLPEKGLLIGNTLNMNDLKEWAKKIDAETLPSGGAGFFDAILEKRSNIKQNYDDTSFDDNKNLLYVCGSNFPISKQAVLDARAKGHVVVSMPDSIYNNRLYNQELIDQWSDEIIQKYKSNKKIIISVLQQPGINTIRGWQIKNILGLLVKSILNTIAIDELFIEGGSTAYIITQKLEINAFFPIQSIAPGVARMRVENKKGLCLTVKPGSYVWPKSIWKFN